MCCSPDAIDFWMKIYTKIAMWDLNTGIDITFQNVFIHPMFEPSPLYDDYDMAILELSQPIPMFSYNVIPICVPWLSKFKDQN